MTTNKRKYLKKFCTKRELNKLLFLYEKLACANQSLRPEALPDNVPDNKLLLILRAALEQKAKTMLAESIWWRKCMDKYDLPLIVSIDLQSREFYYIE